jgi:hypothetical protein
LSPTSQVLVERERRAVEHVRLKQGPGADVDAPLGFGQQREQPIVDVRRRAVIGVKGDEDGACRGDLVGVARERARTQEGVLHCRPG